MADTDGLLEARDFTGPAATAGAFHVKGAQAQDWGLQNRLSRIFRRDTGRTVMLAFDHGYFLGPMAGLERLDTGIAPLVPDADAIMMTRGALRTSIPPHTDAGIVLRASGGPSVLRDLSDEHIALDIEDAVRLDAAALAIQVFIGSENESRSVRNLAALVDAGQRRGVAVLGVTAVGKDMVRDARYFRLATRISAEMGAHVVKTYYVEEGFETVTAETLPGADHRGRRQEAARTGRPHHGPPLHPGGCRRRRHGPEHLPKRAPCRHARRRPGRRARRCQARGGLRAVPGPRRRVRLTLHERRSRLRLPGPAPTSGSPHVAPPVRRGCRRPRRRREPESTGWPSPATPPPAACASSSWTVPTPIRHLGHLQQAHPRRPQVPRTLRLHTGPRIRPGTASALPQRPAPRP
ncbi:3-hydroxy-5-phosphonooxypentane-2,4-dione thiolase [Streptomyces hirsutus]